MPPAPPPPARGRALPPPATDPAAVGDRVAYVLVGLLCVLGAPSLKQPRFRALDYAMAAVCATLNTWATRGGETYVRHRARVVLVVRVVLAGTAPALMATGLRSVELPTSWAGFLLRRNVIVVYGILTATARSASFASFVVTQTLQALLFIGGQPRYCRALLDASPAVVPYYRALADAATTSALAFAGDRALPRAACPAHACPLGQSTLILLASIIGAAVGRCGGTRRGSLVAGAIAAYCGAVALALASALAPCGPPPLNLRLFLLAPPAAVPPGARARQRLSSVAADAADAAAWLRRALAARPR